MNFEGPLSEEQKAAPQQWDVKGQKFVEGERYAYCTGPKTKYPVELILIYQADGRYKAKVRWLSRPGKGKCYPEISTISLINKEGKLVLESYGEGMNSISDKERKQWRYPVYKQGDKVCFSETGAHAVQAKLYGEVVTDEQKKNFILQLQRKINTVEVVLSDGVKVRVTGYGNPKSIFINNEDLKKFLGTPRVTQEAAQAVVETSAQETAPPVQTETVTESDPPIEGKFFYLTASQITGTGKVNLDLKRQEVIQVMRRVGKAGKVRVRFSNGGQDTVFFGRLREGVSDNAIKEFEQRLPEKPLKENERVKFAPDFVLQYIERQRQEGRTEVQNFETQLLSMSFPIGKITQSTVHIAVRIEPKPTGYQDMVIIFLDDAAAYLIRS